MFIFGILASLYGLGYARPMLLFGYDSFSFLGKRANGAQALTLSGSLVTLLLLLLFSGCAGKFDSASASKAHHNVSPQQRLVLRSARAVWELRESSLYPGFEQALARAEGILIFPQYFRMALLGSLSGGNGVLLGRDLFGEWSSPAFYEMGRAGFGMQAGVSSGALVYLFFDREYMLAGLEQGFDLSMGTDVVVFGSVDRAGVSRLATDQPVLLYSEMLGMYAGVSFDGGFVRPVPSANRDYYERDGAAPEHIVVRRMFWNDAAAPLREALIVAPGEAEQDWQRRPRDKILAAGL